jgi:DNA-binding response OmpR family regulator
MDYAPPASPEFDRRSFCGNGRPATRILIVDSDPASLGVIDDVLRTDGYFTATAFDATGAGIVADRLWPFELVVTAARLPDASGVEFVSDLRRRDPSLPALYLTTCADELFADPVPSAPGTDVLVKPFEHPELVEAVWALLYWRTQPWRTS